MPPKGAEESFLDFLESHSSYVSPEHGVAFEWQGGKPRETLFEMWRESGSPYITNYSAEELLAQDRAREVETYRDFPRAFFTQGERSMWDVAGMWEKGRSLSPDTLHIQKGNMREFFAELAHAEQYKDKWDFGPGTRDWRSGKAMKKHGDEVYYTEYLEDLEPEMAVETSYYTGRPFPQRKTKSIEYEAHQEIEPRLERRFRESFDKWEE